MKNALSNQPEVSSGPCLLTANSPSWNVLKDIVTFWNRPCSEFHRHLAETFPSTVAELAASSPVKIPTDRTEQARLLLTLFKEDDPISVSWPEGDFDSYILGQEIEPRKEIAKRISKFTLVEPRVISDAVIEYEEVRESPPIGDDCFLVVTPTSVATGKAYSEFCASVFKWLTAELGLRLSAVVREHDCLQGWFGGISELAWETLRMVLPSLDICFEEAFEFTHLGDLPNQEAVELIYFSK